MMTDGVSDLDAAHLNQYVSAASQTIKTMIAYGVVDIVAGVATATPKIAVGFGNLSEPATNQFEVTFTTPFVTRPAVQLTVEAPSGSEVINMIAQRVRVSDAASLLACRFQLINPATAAVLTTPTVRVNITATGVVA